MRSGPVRRTAVKRPRLLRAARPAAAALCAPAMARAAAPLPRGAVRRGHRPPPRHRAARPPTSMMTR
eukprot:7648381-Lingulodinium_polyedra.AAC.1